MSFNITKKGMIRPIEILKFVCKCCGCEFEVYDDDPKLDGRTIGMHYASEGMYSLDEFEDELVCKGVAYATCPNPLCKSSLEVTFEPDWFLDDIDEDPIKSEGAILCRCKDCGRSFRSEPDELYSTTRDFNDPLQQVGAPLFGRECLFCKGPAYAVKFSGDALWRL